MFFFNSAFKSTRTDKTDQHTAVHSRSYDKGGGSIHCLEGSTPISCDACKQIVCSQALLYLPKLLEQAMHCPDEQSSSQSAMCYASVISKISSSENCLCL